MKRTVIALSVILAVTALAGCEVTGPRVKLKPPVTVEGDHRHRDHHDDDHDDDHDHDGKFCPPGQAKKGRC